MTVPAVLEAVGELIRPHRMIIEVTTEVRYGVTAPCLLRQLADCIGNGTELGAIGGERRLPLNVDALDLWHEITHNAHAWADNVGVSRRAPLEVRQHPIPWAGRLLRTTAATALSKGSDFVDLVDSIEMRARRWAGQITTMVTGRPDVRGVRGAACPACSADFVLEVAPSPNRSFDPSATADLYRRPAIVLAVRQVDGYTLRWLTCLACEWSESLPYGTPDEVAWVAA